MDPKNWKIVELPGTDDAEHEALKRGLIPIPPEQVEQVRKMSPAERKRWAKHWATERFKRRQARKAQRAARKRQKALARG